MQGGAAPHWHQGAGACEIEVDIETGKLTIVRYAGASWAGKVVNPVRARAQDQGNIIYGIGPALYEEMIFDHGQVINANLVDYLIPSFLDIPPVLRTTSLESQHADADMHGIGEMTLPCVAPALANALYDALGIRIRTLPLTAERILRALQNDA
jgi:CO/xanthine dehydrogenase Mo-binding subunit